MNQHVTIEDQWSWWRAATAGNRPPLPSNQEPQSGYYRDGQRAVAIWRTDGGDLVHSVTAGHRYASIDTLNDAFGRFCMRPVSEDLFFAVAEGAAWPEDVGPEIETTLAGIGHNSATPAEQVRDELEAIAISYARWLGEIGGRITTEEHSEKAKGFQERALGVEKGAAAKHKAEKEPHLAAGREVDARWITGPTSIKAQAETLKRRIGSDRTPYLQQKERLAAEAERKAREEHERLQREAEDRRRVQAEQLAAAGSINATAAPILLPPEPVLPAIPRRQPTGLKTFRDAEILDLGKVAAVIAALDRPPADFVEAVRKWAKATLLTGASVEGAKLIEERRA